MLKPEHLPPVSREEWLALVAERQRQMAALRAEIDELTRGGTRQAAPVAKGPRVAEPKPPGRQPGPGMFRDREAPPPEDMTTPPVAVKVTQEACPACGGPLEEQRVAGADMTELPARPRPQVTQDRVWGCRCPGCGHQVRGQHADVAPDQHGATAHRLGPRVMAVAPVLHDGVGIPGRKVPAVMAAWTGVRLTQGALSQAALRRPAGSIGTGDEQRRAAVPEAPVGHTDAPGWRVGGKPAHLRAVETEAAPVSQVRPRPRHEAVQEVSPTSDAGGMVTDRGRRDDAPAGDGGDQQKGLAHILRSISDVVETTSGRAGDFGAQLKALLQEALALGHARRDGTVTDVKVAAEALQAELTYHLRDRRRPDPDHPRRLKERGWHHDRGNVVRFLAAPQLEPTTHRAERAWRPAGIARKVSPGANSDQGAYTFAAFTSVVRTLAQQSAAVLVEGLYPLFRTPSIQGTPP